MRSAVLFAAAVAVAVAVNLALVGSMTRRDDPVGRLTPTATLPAAPPVPPSEPEVEADD